VKILPNSSIIVKEGLSGNRGWNIQLYDDNASFDNVVCFQLASNSTTQIEVCSAVSAAPANSWIHVAGVYAPSQSITVYVDGSQSGQQTTDIPASQFNSSRPVEIGSRTDVTNLWYDGLITDVRVYSRALSVNEIETLAKSRLKYVGISSDSLVGYWPLDDCSDGTSGDGVTFVDRSGSGNNGTGVDGANNTGLTCKGSSYLSYP